MNSLDEQVTKIADDMAEQEYQKNRTRFENKLKVREINKAFDYLKENGIVRPNMARQLGDDVIGFDSGYGRIGIVWIDYQTCLACKQKKQCLIIDSSEGEYNQASICFDDIELLRKVNE